MADERLPCWRSVSMLPTRSDRLTRRVAAISFRPRQNASSRLTLVLCPAMTIERFTTGDFIARLPLSYPNAVSYYESLAMYLILPTPNKGERQEVILSRPRRRCARGDYNDTVRSSGLINGQSPGFVRARAALSARSQSGIEAQLNFGRAMRVPATLNTPWLGQSKISASPVGGMCFASRSQIGQRVTICTS